jgi:dihydroorotase
MSDEERSENPFFGVAPFNLTIAMTELLALGLDLDEVVATVSANPAKLLRMQDEIGTLAPGRIADVSVLELATGRFKLSDNSGVEVVTERLLRPAWCLAAGERFAADSPLVPPAIEVAA